MNGNSVRGLFVLATLIAAAARPVLAQSFDSAPWQHVLDKHVNEAGRVDYSALKSDSHDLDQFAAEIAARSPLSDRADFSTPHSQMAYWINAYNALVMKGVVENWPVRSVLKIGLLPHSFFWGKKFVVGGRAMTLDDIEKEQLRKQFGDPRVHFALNCASNSCPPLRREVFTPDGLDQQLDAAVRDFIDSLRGMKIDAAANHITLSPIFKWYSGDFEVYVRQRDLSGTGPVLLAFIRLYASEPKRRAIEALRNPRIEFFDYDWGVNDVRTVGR